MDALLDHLERTFAESYRKEIDQEENVWRSLPFFAATLALQLAALTQVRDWVGLVGGALFLAAAGLQLAALTQVRDWVGLVGGALFLAAAGLLLLAGVATVLALVSLGASVWPADFRRVAPEPAFLDYAEQVRADTQRAAPPGIDPAAVAEQALITVKAALAEQYALAVTNNRRVNERRAKWRTRSGLATITSVFAVLVLVGMVVVTNLHRHA